MIFFIFGGSYKSHFVVKKLTPGNNFYFDANLFN